MSTWTKDDQQQYDALRRKRDDAHAPVRNIATMLAPNINGLHLLMIQQASKIRSTLLPFDEDAARLTLDVKLDASNMIEHLIQLSDLAEQMVNSNPGVPMAHPYDQGYEAATNKFGCMLAGIIANPLDEAAAYIAVRMERKRQDERWGMAYDDKNTIIEWHANLNAQVQDLQRVVTDQQVRRQYVKIAALAVAAIESIDRSKKK